MALLMLPRVVLTHLKAGFRVALRPDPVMIGWWTQPALPTPVKQCRRSLTTVLAGWKLRCPKVAISARRKPFTRRNFKRIGLPSGVVSTKGRDACAKFNFFQTAALGAGLLS